MNLATFNTRPLSIEAGLAGLFEQFSVIAWNIIGLSKVRRTGEAYTVLNNGHVLCNRCLSHRREFGVGFLVNKDIAGNIHEFYSYNERVAVVLMKLNRRYRMKLVKAYAITSTHDDEEIQQFYEDVELAMRKVKTPYTVVIGDFNAKVGKKQAREQAIGNYDINSRNARGEMLIEFAERNRLRIMNTFFRKHSDRKWTYKSRNGETRNEIDFTLSANPRIMQDLELLSRVKCSDHRLVMSRIYLYLKREIKISQEETSQPRGSKGKSRPIQAGARKQICSFKI